MGYQTKNVGERVQYIDDNDKICAGVLEEIVKPASYNRPANWWNLPKEKHLKWQDCGRVQLDSGKEAIVPMNELDLEDTAAEREFREAYMVASQEINDKMSEAYNLVKEACKVSEKYGVPFSASVSPLSNSYTPNSFSSKFPEVDREFVQELTETYSPDTEYGGWQHSAVC